jgi:TPR repeat protein
MLLCNARRWIVAIVALIGAASAGAQTDPARAAFEREDYTTAAKLFRPLAESGDAEAQYRLGLMFRFGWGVDKDMAAAVHWLSRAADAQHAGAMTELGNMYRLGRGVPEDAKRAAQLLTGAAERGNGFAQLAIGRMHRTGTGVERDLVSAWAWFTLAIENQVMDAVSHRNEIAEQMNEEQLTAAKALADKRRKQTRGSQ